MHLPRQNFARIKTLTYLYADACERGYEQYLALTERINEIGEVEYDPELEELTRQHDIAGLQTIVFAGMCFESAIYEYAADHLGDVYVQDHLDKLDVLSKWLIVLRFVAGYELRKDQAPYAALKGLVSARNKLVHSKSEPFDFDNAQKQLARIQEEEKMYIQSIHNAYRAILLVSMELESKLGPMNNPFPSYDPKVAPLRDTPAKLKPVVSECRAIVTRIRDA